VPGEIVTVRPRRHWRYAGHPYLSGDIEATRLDVAALGIVPLRLEPCGTWDPAEEYWGEEGELGMNPGDNQGIRFLLPAVLDGRPWENSIP
jgi:hypothetical protein